MPRRRRSSTSRRSTSSSSSKSNTKGSSKKKGAKKEHTGTNEPKKNSSDIDSSASSSRVRSVGTQTLLRRRDRAARGFYIICSICSTIIPSFYVLVFTLVWAISTFDPELYEVERLAIQTEGVIVDTLLTTARFSASLFPSTPQFLLSSSTNNDNQVITTENNQQGHPHYIVKDTNSKRGEDEGRGINLGASPHERSSSSQVSSTEHQHHQRQNSLDDHYSHAAIEKEKEEEEEGEGEAQSPYVLRRFTQSLRNFAERISPGTIATNELGRTKHSPVVLVPGIISTGLELWLGKKCILPREMFRKRIWGSRDMMYSLLRNPTCWLEHMSLNHSTWGDKEGIKLRASSGLGAADYFLPGLRQTYVLGNLISELAAVGYDENSMYLASYDWRLSPRELENRDMYFSRLKSQFEILVKQNNGNRVVVVAHSMGASVFLYFLKWVESDKGGNGGPLWVDQHIRVVFSVGGSLLGAALPIAGSLSGEHCDVPEINELAVFMKEKMFTENYREKLTDFYRSLGSFPLLYPKGGKEIWGDDLIQLHIQEKLEKDRMMGSTKTRRRENKRHHYDNLGKKRGNNGILLDQYPARMKEDDVTLPFRKKQMDPQELWSFFEKFAPRYFQLVKDNYNLQGTDLLGSTVETHRDTYRETSAETGTETSAETIETEIHRDVNVDTSTLTDTDTDTDIDTNEESSGILPKDWTNPFTFQLPNASRMTIVCAYGFEIETPMRFRYNVEVTRKKKWELNENKKDDNNEITIRMETSSSEIDQKDHSRLSTSQFSSSSSTSSSEATPTQLGNSVIMGKGDGTVSLLSLGYPCSHLWKANKETGKPSRHNPFGVETVNREYRHQMWGRTLEPEDKSDLKETDDVPNKQPLLSSVTSASFKSFIDPLPNMVKSFFQKNLEEFYLSVRGEYSSHHLGITGNVEFIEDVLRTVTAQRDTGGSGEELELKDRIFSKIIQKGDQVQKQLLEKRRSRRGKRNKDTPIKK
eukprot:g1071.t1